MQPNDFNENAPGKVIKTLNGYWAFVPEPLPPEITWTNPLLSRLSNADRSLGRLAEVGASFPSPHAVVRPFVRREAVLQRRKAKKIPRQGWVRQYAPATYRVKAGNSAKHSIHLGVTLLG